MKRKLIPASRVLSAMALLLASVCGFGQPASSSTVISSNCPKVEASPLRRQPRAQSLDLKTLRCKAESGDPEMQYELGHRYENGVGLRENSARAAKWYRKAAEQNLARAQYSLGRLYAAGEGLPQNYAEALNWFYKAAAQDHALAKNRIGVMFERAQGVTQDYVEAYKWYAQAAGRNQNIFGVANRDTLAHRMTSEQVQEAQRRADSILTDSSLSLARVWMSGSKST